MNDSRSIALNDTVNDGALSHDGADKDATVPAPLTTVRWEPDIPNTAWMRRQIVEHIPEPLSPLRCERRHRWLTWLPIRRRTNCSRR